MNAVEVMGCGGGDEKLAAGTLDLAGLFGGGKNTLKMKEVVLLLVDLIVRSTQAPSGRFALPAVGIATLNHEAREDSVESRVVVIPFATKL